MPRVKKLVINRRKMPRGVIRDGDDIYVRLWQNGEVFKKKVGHISDPTVADNAIALCNKMKEQQRLGKLGITEPDQPLLIEHAADLFLRLHGQNRKSVKGKKRFERYNVLMKAKWGGRYVHTISATDVQKYRQDRLGEGVTESTVNKEHTAIRTFFKKLVEWRKAEQIPKNVRLPEGNPACEVKKANEDQYIRNRLLKVGEWESLWAAADNRSRRIMLAATQWPLRLDDLKGLRKSKIDHRRGMIMGRQSKTGREFWLPIDEVGWELIKTSPGDLILDWTGFDQRWKRIKRRAGMKDFQFRDLRREAATSLLDSGKVSLREIQEMLGHAQLTTTIRYLGLRVTNLQSAGGVLSAKYRPPTVSPAQTVRETVREISEIEVGRTTERIENTRISAG